jgi:hypothetical protein
MRGHLPRWSFHPVLDGRFVVSEDINIAVEGELVEQATAEAAQHS